VTYLLDGRPLGTDTTRPYALDVNVGFLPPGAHRLRVTAVDSLGRSASGRAVRFVTVRGAGDVVRASPSGGLGSALEALRSGGTTVVLGPGRYILNDVVLGDGARLIGSGPRTIVTAPRRSSYFALLRVHGSGVRISHLTLDGAGRGPGQGVAIAVAHGSSDVRLQRLRIVRVRGYGVDVWGRHSDVSVQDSYIDGGGSAHAGVLALESGASRDVSVIRTTIRRFRSYGIDFAQSAYGRRSAGLHALALDNRIADIRDPARARCYTRPELSGCGTNEAGIESGAVAATIVGNTIERTAWDGVETVGSSTTVTVVGNSIRRTRTGIYLEHSTNRSLIAANVISDVRTGINVEWRYGAIGSARNTFVANRVVGAREAGLFLDVGSDRNGVADNSFVEGARPAIVLQGSSLNLVRANRACGTDGPFVREQAGRFDDGRLAQATRNRIEGNVGDGSCRAS
jgi:copper-binding protein NosD